MRAPVSRFSRRPRHSVCVIARTRTPPAQNSVRCTVVVACSTGSRPGHVQWISNVETTTLCLTVIALAGAEIAGTSPRAIPTVTHTRTTDPGVNIVPPPAHGRSVGILLPGTVRAQPTTLTVLATQD